MSRIGKLPISVPSGVQVNVQSPANIVVVKGQKGELKQKVSADISVSVDNGTVQVNRPTDQKRHKALHGLYRTLISNMIEGVSNGFKKELSLVGVGYRASNKGQILEMALGYSHPIYFVVPAEVKVKTETVKGKSPLIILESIDKQLLGQVAAKIRSFRKPEPYKGKGIRFLGEEIRRKAGKSAGR